MQQLHQAHNNYSWEFFLRLMSPWLILLLDVGSSSDVEVGLGPSSQYSWGAEDSFNVPGDIDTRKTRCGWFRDGNTGCSADWRPICQQMMSRLSDPSWQSKDVVTLDFLRNVCGTVCHSLKSNEECSNFSAGNMICHWLSFDSIESGSNSGVCVTRSLIAELRRFGMHQYHMGRDQELQSAFITQYYQFMLQCSQLGLRNENSCKQRGSPCIWRPHLTFSTIYTPCHVDDLAVLEMSSPELAEFFSPDTFCQHRDTEEKCLNAHVEKDLSLKTFIMMRASIWPYYLTIFTVVISILMMLKLCKMPPPPFIHNKRNSVVQSSSIEADQDALTEDIIPAST